MSSASAQEAPWGWWDDGDSIARPDLLDDAAPEGPRGAARLSLASAPGGEPANRRLDTRLEAGSWRADLSGRCGEGCAGIRQRLSRLEGAIQGELGDLPPWTGDPLLASAGHASSGASPLARLGSGSGPAGTDLRIDLPDLLPWPSSSRVRLASVPGGGARGALQGEVGAFRAGAAWGDASSSSPIPLGGVRLDGPSAAVEASHLGTPGEGSWRLSLRSEGSRLRQEWSLYQGASGGPPARGREEARARVRWSGDATRLEWEGLAVGDGPSGSDLRSTASVSRDLAGAVWRLRGRWRRGEGRASSALVPGVRRREGRFRPWFEVAWSDEAAARPSAGAAWIDRAWRLEASATRRAGRSWDWSSSSSLAGGSASLRLDLVRRDAELGGGGTWTVAW